MSDFFYMAIPWVVVAVLSGAFVWLLGAPVWGAAMFGMIFSQKVFDDG